MLLDRMNVLLLNFFITVSVWVSKFNLLYITTPRNLVSASKSTWWLSTFIVLILLFFGYFPTIHTLRRNSEIHNKVEIILKVEFMGASRILKPYL